MKFLSSTLTVLLKFIFFSVFLSGVFILSILHTYLDKDYYEDYFAEKFIEVQSEHISGMIEEQAEKLPFKLSGEQINDALIKVFTEENIKEAFGALFGTIENYNGETIVIDLQHFKEIENEFVNELVESSIGSLEPCDSFELSDIVTQKICLPTGITKFNIKKELNVFLNKNINFGIPPTIEISTESSSTDNIFKTLQFVLIHKTTVDILIITLILLPLLGIFLLNAHPFYKGLRKVSTSLMQTGAITGLFQTFAVLGIRLLNFNPATKAVLEDANVTLTPEKMKDIFDFAFGGMFNIITVIGLITLGIGIVLYVISRLVKSKYEYSY